MLLDVICGGASILHTKVSEYPHYCPNDDVDGNGDGNDDGNDHADDDAIPQVYWLSWFNVIVLFNDNDNNNDNDDANVNFNDNVNANVDANTYGNDTDD